MVPLPLPVSLVPVPLLPPLRLLVVHFEAVEGCFEKPRVSSLIELLEGGLLLEGWRVELDAQLLACILHGLVAIGDVKPVHPPCWAHLCPEGGTPIAPVCAAELLGLLLGLKPQLKRCCTRKPRLCSRRLRRGLWLHCPIFLQCGGCRRCCGCGRRCELAS